MFRHMHHIVRPFIGSLVAGLLALARPTAASAQVRLSLGVGGGIAGSTDASLSNGRAAPILMGQVTASVVPLIGIGAEADYWRRSVSAITFATGIAQLHVPATSLFVKLGVGYGSGDPDGRGTVSGTAGEIGAAYDITFPAAPVALTLFGNALLAHAALRSFQMVEGGLAITWR